MASIWTKQWAKATVERVLSSAAGGALSVLGAGAVDVLAADWQTVGSIAAGAGIVSLLKSVIAATAVGEKGSPSLGTAERMHYPNPRGSA